MPATTRKIQFQTCITVFVQYAIYADFMPNIKPQGTCNSIYYTPNDYSITKHSSFLSKLAEAITTYNLPWTHKFLLRTNFHGQVTPTKIKPMKICTHEELATVIYNGLLRPTKTYPLKNLTHEILWPRKFLCLRYAPHIYIPVYTIAVCARSLETY